MSSLEWALIQYDWYRHKKWKLGHREVQREDHVKTQGENRHPQAKERDLRRNQPSDIFDLRLLASVIVTQ